MRRIEAILAVSLPEEPKKSWSPPYGHNRSSLDTVPSWNEVLSPQAGLNNLTKYGRLWWMLKWVGHEQVAVLNGGFAAWQDAGFEVSDSVESIAASSFRTAANPDLIISTAGLEEALLAGNAPTVVDARDSARFAGKIEPIDSVAGHVPGALNHPFSESINTKGAWKNQQELRNGWSGVLGADTDLSWICMCGSGVTACHLALSAGLAGYRPPRLYVGSWSEWIQDPGRPVATDTE